MKSLWVVFGITFISEAIRFQSKKPIQNVQRALIFRKFTQRFDIFLSAALQLQEMRFNALINHFS